MGGLLAEARRRRLSLTVWSNGWVAGAWALRNGDIDTAVRELEGWRAEAGPLASELVVLIQALLAAGAVAEAHRELAAYRTMLDPRPLIEARLSHTEGLVYRAEGDVAAAETLHYAVLAAAHEAGWRPLVAHSLEALAGTAATHQSFAECARLASAGQALRDEMGYVLRWPFEQRLLDADLAAARAGLGEDAFATAYAEGRGLDENAAVAYATRARGERRRPAHGWDSLTATEANVARLAAAGFTNKQIARRLLVGAETVKTHMARVYDKTRCPYTSQPGHCSLGPHYPAGKLVTISHQLHPLCASPIASSRMRQNDGTGSDAQALRIGDPGDPSCLGCRVNPRQKCGSALAVFGRHVLYSTWHGQSGGLGAPTRRSGRLLRGPFSNAGATRIGRSGAPLWTRPPSQGGPDNPLHNCRSMV
jgi:DNA-binding CsgD family transcriptional regulator